MKNVNIYVTPLEQARENGELEQWRTSLDLTMECRAALGAAIALGCDGRTMSGVDVGPVVKEYGYPRIYMVLASTILQHRGDGRISRAVSDWAKTVPTYPPDWDRDYFAIDSLHPGLADELVKMVKRSQNETVEARKPRVTLYRHSRAEAVERGELDRWQASHDLNVEVACTLTEAINERPANTRWTVRLAVDDYGIERVMWVLANTVQLIKPTDPLISADNRAWAKEVPVPFDGKDMQYTLYVRSHPGDISTAICAVQQLLQERSGAAQPPAERGNDEDGAQEAAECQER